MDGSDNQLNRLNSIRALVLAIVSVWPALASAYIPQTRWTTTSAGATGTTGDPITLRWSLVANGTTIPQEDPSNLVSYLDSQIGSGVGGSDLTLRPWFHIFSESFARWSALGGITFVYEPHDDGLQLGSAAGVSGVRGDIRIGGALIDGSGGTLAYTNYPNNGDIVVDTGEGAYYADPTNNYRTLRNVLMHELGHAFGLAHVESSTDRLLMEPFIDTTFDGPQLDDIRGIQGQYGDVYEKSFNGAGNDVLAHATSLGAIAAGATRTIGRDAATGQSVGANEIDFVSIANAADFDFFSFTVAGPATLAVDLTPLGGVFNQGAQGAQQSSFNANARNDLALSVFGPNGTTTLGSADNTSAGFSESLSGLALSAAGQYFVRVSGANGSVQPYQLQLSVAEALPPSADFDGDGDVDGEDFLALQRALGSSGGGVGDANHDGVVNVDDVAVFEQQFGEPAATPTLGAVPEPGGATLGFLASAIGIFCLRRPNSL